MELRAGWREEGGADRQLDLLCHYFNFGDNWVIVRRNVYVLGFKRIFCVMVQAMRVKSLIGGIFL